MLTIAKYDRYDMVNNIGDDKPSFTVWFSGCNIRCPECHNKALWDKESGEETSVDDVVSTIVAQAEKLDLDTVILLGGEPLEQDLRDIVKLCADIHSHGLKIWLYTGHDFDDIPIAMRDYLSVVKCGRYIESLSCSGFPSSSNQELWHNVNNSWSIMDRWFN